jgi:hypothetical protein
MKKAALVVLSLSLTVAFSACDSSSDSASGTTSRTTAQVRGELAGFQTQYQSLSCPVSDLSASAFVSMMDTSLGELDSLIGQIPG